MENKVRKKRSKNVSANKEISETTIDKNRIRPSSANAKKSSAAEVVSFSRTPKVLNMPINPETARQAIILSEVIGKPVSKRGKRW
ncbi:MAG: hypothetical protein FWD38_04880 [Oscillospiraceae bacterium]|nr:hypothetical protein [Oscillospiraceae bacterium]